LGLRRPYRFSASGILLLQPRLPNRLRNMRFREGFDPGQAALVAGGG